MTAFSLYVLFDLLCLLSDQVINVLICCLLICDLFSDGLGSFCLKLIQLLCFGVDQLFVRMLLQLDLLSNFVKEFCKDVILALRLFLLRLELIT